MIESSLILTSILYNYLADNDNDNENPPNSQNIAH